MKLPQTFNFGDLKVEDPILFRQLSEMYAYLALALNNRPETVKQGAAPTSPADINKNFQVGDFWIDQAADKVYCLTNRTDDINVTWSILN